MPTLPATPLSFIDSAHTGEIFEGRSAEDRLDPSRPYVTRTYSRSFRVTATSPRVGAGIIREATKLIWNIYIGQPYINGTAGTDAWAESDDTAFCTSIHTEPVTDDGEWRVTCQYEPVDPVTIAGMLDPLDLPLEISWDGQEYERVIEKDYSYDTATPPALEAKPLVNSTGDPFDPPVTTDDARTTLVVVRNEPLYDEVAGTGFDDTIPEILRNKVNSTTFFGREPLTVLCKRITAQYVWHPAFYDPDASPPNPGYYARVTYEFHINKDTWVKKILDAGYRELDGTTHTPKQILIDSIPATSPVLLNGSGGLATRDSTTHKIEPTYLEFWVHDREDFADVLGFGGTV